MSNVMTAKYINQIQFYQMPKVFFQDPKYIPMRNESKLAYMLFRDLLPLSIENNWVNDNNELFVKLSRTKLMELLNIKGTQKIAQVMKELVDYKLIIYKQVGLTKCNEIYVCIPDSTPEDIVKCEKQTSANLENTPLEISKSNATECENQTHINTNNTKTNISQSFNQREEGIEGTINQSKDEQMLVNDLDRVHRLLNEQVHIEDLKQHHDCEFIDEIANNICEMYLNKNTRIGHEDKPQAIIRGVINKLQMYHIEHVIAQFHRAAALYEIYNPKRYLQTMIYNSVYEANTRIKGDIKHRFGY